MNHYKPTPERLQTINAAAQEMATAYASKCNTERMRKLSAALAETMQQHIDDSKGALTYAEGILALGGFAGRCMEKFSHNMGAPEAGWLAEDAAYLQTSILTEIAQRAAQAELIIRQQADAGKPN